MPRFENKLQGVVLIVVLLFLQIFAWLSLSMLESHILSTKMSHTYFEQHKNFVIAENILKRIENSEMPSCEIAIIDRKTLLLQSDDWWNEVGCAGFEENLQYVYVFEKLGEECALNDAVAVHLRLTLRLMNPAKELLQSTLIKMDNATQNCQGTPHEVAVGRISWRQL